MTGDPLPCGCHTGPWWGVGQPPRCQMHSIPFVQGPFQLQPLPVPPLSDADVDRIARRVAEILREAKP